MVWSYTILQIQQWSQSKAEEVLDDLGLVNMQNSRPVKVGAFSLPRHYFARQYADDGGAIFAIPFAY